MTGDSLAARIRSRVSRTRLLKRGEGKAFDMDLARWLAHHQQLHLSDCKWQGVQVVKNPLDMWIFQEIVWEVKPQVLVEIGTYAGGSALFLAQVLDAIGQGIVVTIDLDRSVHAVEHPRIVTITGDSSSEAVLARVRELCSGKTVMVIHDGDHNCRQVLKDLREYEELVSVGSYLIVEDGIVDQFRHGAANGMFGDYRQGGPLAAVREFLAENDDFAVDSSRERYILTNNPEGYLKRIK